MTQKYTSTRTILLFAVIMLAALIGSGQSTEFTYQGKLIDGGAPANALYDFEFRLFDAETAGGQLGVTQSKPGISVVNGVFTVELDFGHVFHGPGQWLEIAISPAGAGTFTTLAPRQKLTSAPKAVIAATAGDLDCSECIDGQQISSVPGNKVSGPVAQAEDASNLNGLPAVRYVSTDAGGNVGLGTTPGTGSKLTVAGQVELTAGGIKFPDATTQNSAALSTVSVQSPITGNGTAGSPLGIQTPLTVINADNPARQPFYKDTANQDLLNLFNVPTGKTLVIEHVSGAVRWPTTQGTPTITVAASDGSSSVLLIPELSIAFQDSTTSWFFSAPVKTYLLAGKTMVLFLPAGTVTSQQFRINGHLVDTP
jgi:hypothetical protein